MTIKTKRDAAGEQLVVECDECGDERESGTTNFARAVREARENGFSVVKDGNTWKHYCISCG